MGDIVIDLETLGTKPGCPIIEIGACVINNRTGEITDNFSRRVGCGFTAADLKDGGAVDADMRRTVAWWLGDPRRAETFEALLSGFGTTPGARDALYEFHIWFESVTLGEEGVRLWANGPAFDITILRSAFDHHGMPLPWVCHSERCVRTGLEMANYERGSIGWVERGPRHRALNDARHEARKLFYTGALGEVSAIMLRLRQRYDVKARQA